MSKYQKMVLVGFVIWCLFTLITLTGDRNIATVHPYPDSLQSMQSAVYYAFAKVIIGGVLAFVLFKIFSLIKD